MLALLVFIYLCRCTSSVCLLNIALQCVFNIQLWGYFFLTRAERISKEKNGNGLVSVIFFDLKGIHRKANICNKCCILEK
jgi:hypothetical protein